MEVRELFDLDEQSVRKVLADETGEFEQLVRRHFGRVYAVAYANLSDREAAEDLAQEVFLRAYLHLGTLENPRLFPAWVVRIARNLASTWRRNGQRASRLLTLLPMEEIPMEISDGKRRSPREEAAAREEQELLRESIMQLPPNLREVVLLHYAEGVSQAEIARSLGVDRSAVNRQISRALELLRSGMESDLTAAAASLRPSAKACRGAALAAAVAAGLPEGAKAALVAASLDTAVLGSLGAASAGAAAAGAGSASGGAGAVGKAGAALKSLVSGVLSLKGAVAVALLAGTVVVGSRALDGKGSSGAGSQGGREGTASQIAQAAVSGSSPSADGGRNGRRTGQPGNRGTGSDTADSSVGSREDGTAGPDGSESGQPASLAPSADSKTSSSAASSPLGAGATVAGGVYDREGREGVPGVTVWLRPTDGNRASNDSSWPETTTDEVGQFVFKEVPAGGYVFGGKKGARGLLPGEEIKLRAGETTEGITLSLYAGHTMSGKVTEKETGRPLAGVEIHPGYRVNDELVSTVLAVTDERGEYRIEGMVFEQKPLRPFRLFVPVKKGYVLMTPQGNPAVGAIQVEVKPETLEIRCDMEMLPTVTASGRVVTESGEGVAGAQVSTGASSVTRVGGESVTTREDGRFEIPIPSNMGTKLVARHGQFGTGYSDAIYTGVSAPPEVEIVLKPEVAISGRVVDPNGNRVAGASVTLTEWAVVGNSRSGSLESPVETDAQGEFVVDDIEATLITIKAEREGFAPSVQQEVDLKSGNVQPLELQLRPSHYLAGQITGRDGEPLKGVRVVALLGGGQEDFSASAESDAQGRYRLDGIPEGKVSVNLHHPAAGHKAIHDQSLDRDNADYSYADSGPALTGKVVDWKSGAPVKDFRVTYPPDAVTDPLTPGQFRIELKGSKYFQPRLEAPGYAPLVERVVVPEGVQQHEHLFRMGPGGVATGRIVDADGKTPYLKGKLRLSEKPNPQYYEPRSREIALEPDGSFRAEGVSVEWNELTFTPDDGLPRVTKDFWTKNGETKDLGNFVVTGAGTISGKILRMPSGEPAAGVAVELDDSAGPLQRSAKSEADGSFSFPDLPGSRYYVKQPDRELLVHVELSGGEHEEVVLELWEGKLSGRIRRGSEPAAATKLSLSRVAKDDMTASEARVKPDGSFEVVGLAPGEWTAGVQYRGESGLGGVYFPVTMPETGDLNVDWVIPATVVRVRVTDPEGKPVPGAKVAAKLIPGTALVEAPVNSMAPESISGADGGVLVHDLRPGRYQVSASKNEHELIAEQTVEDPRTGEAREVILQLRPFPPRAQ